MRKLKGKAMREGDAIRRCEKAMRRLLEAMRLDLSVVFSFLF